MTDSGKQQTAANKAFHNKSTFALDSASLILEEKNIVTAEYDDNGLDIFAAYMQI